MKTKHPVRWVVAGVAVIYVVIVSLTHKEKVSPPLITTCPFTLLTMPSSVRCRC